MKLSDTHCHLYMPQFDEDLSIVLEHAFQAGVEFILVPGLDLKTSQTAIQLSEKYKQVFAAVGIHPNEVYQWDDYTEKTIRDFARHPKVLAIGEIGLDFYRDSTDRVIQIEVLRKQLQIAADQDLPLIVHNRQASDDLFPILLDWQKSLSKTGKSHAAQAGVLHAFQEVHPLHDKLIEANFYFGIGGPVTFSNAKNVAGLLAAIPPNRLLLETDAPFLTPHPFRGQRNEPAYTNLIAGKIASLQSKEISDIAETTFDNAARLFCWRRDP